MWGGGWEWHFGRRIYEVTNCEKLVAQGFSKAVHLDLSRRCAVKAAGNAYPVPLMIAVLHGIINLLSTFHLEAWPPLEGQPSMAVVMSAVSTAMREFAKPAPLISKAMATNAKRRSRRERERRKRRRSDVHDM